MATPQVIRLRLAPYCSNAAPTWHELPGYVVGDLAVHRPHFLQPDGESLSHLTDRWTVSHLPSGDRVETATPYRFWERGGKLSASLRDLLAWAEAHQAACPDFYAAARIDDKDAMRLLVGDALNKGKAL